MPMTPDSLHPAWLQALTNTATYPHPVSQIEIKETHISWVALTGEWAYKLKKPVDFGFVNFTTLELRRAACDEELRLNRRTAPDLYKDVIPLTNDGSGPRFGGTGPVLEYAVRMRQFAQEDMLDQCLARGELTDDVVDSLAGEVAELHRQAAVTSSESRFASPDVIHDAVQACLDQLIVSPPSAALETRFNELDQWTNAEWRRLKETFAERKRQGWVRECHGDLHLGNLVLYGGRPTLFDCLEFNPDLRWIDIVNDIAFLMMDLFDHGAVCQAWRLLNAWLRHTGDYHGLRLLKYYMTYRALVRAKVAWLRLQQTDLPSHDGQQQLGLLYSYSELALKLTQLSRPAILLMHGVSGSGKSSVAKQLASSLGAVQIRSDVERKRMFTIEGSAGNCSEMYGPQATRQTYLRLQSLARAVIDSGNSVIVDATFLRQADRRAFAAIASELSVPLVVIACHAAESVLRARILQRLSAGQDPSDADVAVLEKQLAKLEPLDAAEMQMSESIDTATESLKTVLPRLLKRLELVGWTSVMRTADHNI